MDGPPPAVPATGRWSSSAPWWTPCVALSKSRTPWSSATRASAGRGRRERVERTRGLFHGPRAGELLAGGEPGRRRDPVLLRLLLSRLRRTGCVDSRPTRPNVAPEVRGSVSGSIVTHRAAGCYGPAARLV